MYASMEGEKRSINLHALLMVAATVLCVVGTVWIHKGYAQDQAFDIMAFVDEELMVGAVQCKHYKEDAKLYDLCREQVMIATCGSYGCQVCNGGCESQGQCINVTKERCLEKNRQGSNRAIWWGYVNENDPCECSGINNTSNFGGECSENKDSEFWCYVKSSDCKGSTKSSSSFP